MRLVVGPLGLGLDLTIAEGDGPASEVARGLYVVKSEDGTLLRVYLAGLDLQNTGIHLELTPNRSGAPLPRVELDCRLGRVRLVVSDEQPSERKTVLPGIEFGIDDKDGPLFISVPHASLAEDESVTIPVTFAGSPHSQTSTGDAYHAFLDRMDAELGEPTDAARTWARQALGLPTRDAPFQRYRGFLTHLDRCDPDALLQDMRGPRSPSCSAGTTTPPWSQDWPTVAARHMGWHAFRSMAAGPCSTWTAIGRPLLARAHREGKACAE
jgi:hypothetical protein